MTQTLASFLTQELELTSSHKLAAKTGIAHTTIQRMAREDLKNLPEIETLQRLAKTFNLPLWRIMEMAGIDLDLPDDSTTEVRRIASLAAHHERFLEVMSAVTKADRSALDAVAKYFLIHQTTNSVYETVRLFRQGMSAIVELLLQIAEKLELPLTNRHVYMGERFDPTRPYQSPSLLSNGVAPQNMILLNVTVDGKLLSEEMGLGLLHDFEWGFTSAAPLTRNLAQAIFDYEFSEAKHADLRRYAGYFARDVVASLPRDVRGIEWMLESQEILLWLTLVKLCEQTLGTSPVAQP